MVEKKNIISVRHSCWTVEQPNIVWLQTAEREAADLVRLLPGFNQTADPLAVCENMAIQPPKITWSTLQRHTVCQATSALSSAIINDLIINLSAILTGSKKTQVTDTLIQDYRLHFAF